MDDVILDIQRVEKAYQKKTILHPFSYQLGKGRILALCGGNGAGKSTLIRLIVGLTNPTKGSIKIKGMEKKKDKARYLNKIGYMPDDFQFHDSLGAWETIYFYAKLKYIGKTRTKEVLEEVGLADSMHKKMGTFSKGMKQRILLAQALLSNPTLLVLDEPTNGLDPFWVQEFSEMMKKAKNTGQTIIFSTHDLNVAEEIADEVVFLSEGNVISAGAIEEYKELGLYKTFQQLIRNKQRS